MAPLGPGSKCHAAASRQASRPEAFLPDLATSLNNLGNRLSNLGDREGALNATQEAVAIRYHLTETWPRAFVDKLASTVGTLKCLLEESGESPESNPWFEKATTLLARVRPG